MKRTSRNTVAVASPPGSGAPSRPQRTVHQRRLARLGLGLCLQACTDSSINALHLRITEVSANERRHSDGDGEPSDWIELENRGENTINLQGFGLSDDEQDPYRWTFPYLPLDPGERVVVFASGRNTVDPTGPLHTDFRLSRKGEPVLLSGPNLTLVDHAPARELPAGVSLGRPPVDSHVDGWRYFFTPTPGTRNPDDGRPTLTSASGSGLQINEVDASNSGEITDEDGNTPDWIELVNTSSEPLSLAGFSLSDSSAPEKGWRFSSGALEPGGLLLVFASGKDRTSPRPHTNFRLRMNESVRLSDPSGNLLEVVPAGRGHDLGSVGRVDGEWRRLGHATPGRANAAAPLREDATVGAAEQLVINEAMAISRGNPLRGDWVELRNVSEASIDLAGFGLSDNPSQPFRCTIEAGTIEPEEHLVVGLGDLLETPLWCRDTRAPFQLASRGERLILTRPTGEREHHLETGRQTTGLSIGLSGSLERKFFTKPSPGRPNPDEGLGPALQPPEASVRTTDETTLQLSATPPSTTATLRYETGGRVPTASSPQISAPIQVATGEVVRLRSFAPDRLPSTPVSVSLVDHSQHSLPVVDLFVDPVAMFDETRGMHSMGPNASEEYPHVGANFWRRRELEAGVQIRGEDGRLWADQLAGLRIFGGWSRGFDKKGLMMVARPGYGLPVFPVALFDGLPNYLPDEVVLRAGGQDVRRAVVRDAFATALAAGLEVETRPFVSAALYINGDYWGLYNLRPDLDADFFAAVGGTTPEDVVIGSGEGLKSSPGFRPVRAYMKKNKASSPEARAWVEAEVDLDSFFDWLALQVALANVDLGNCQYWRTSTRPWRWIFYDLDLSMSSPQANTVRTFFGSEQAVLPSDVQALWQWLFRHEPYKKRFLGRASLLYRERLGPRDIETTLDTLLEPLTEELERENERWNRTRRWPQEERILRAFLTKRAGYLRKHYTRHFDLDEEEAQDLFPPLEPANDD